MINNLEIEELHLKNDPITGLIAIVAIYDLSRGPALGGCRFVNYSSIDDAMSDAIRLSKAMNNKTIIYQLPYSGGKAVIIKPPIIHDRIQFFHTFGNFINDLNGKFITGCDIGVTKSDMRIVAERSKYITAIDEDDSVDWLSNCTALGLLHACLAAVKISLNKESLKGVHIAIQGMGKIGRSFAEIAYQQGAVLTICDIDPAICKKYSTLFKATIVNSEEIYSVPCDIFSPCSIGRILSKDNIKKISAKIICGGANDQLDHNTDGNSLFNQGILYIPDFVANAGGAIYAAGFYEKIPLSEIKKTIETDVYNLSKLILKKSMSESIPTHEIAFQMVDEINYNR